MRVCMVFPFPFPALDQWEGARTRVLTLCQGLLARGVEVHLLSRRDPAYGSTDFRGISLHQFPFENAQGRKYLTPLLIGRVIHDLNKTHRFDIIHCHLPVVAAGVALWRPSIKSKIIYDTHDWFKVNDEVYYNFPFFPGFLSRIVDAAEVRIARAHDGIIVTTPLLLDAVGAGKRAFVVPNAVDLQLFSPMASTSRRKLLDGASFVLGYVGSVSIDQGIWKLIEAAKIVSERDEEARVLIVGGGALEAAKAYAKSLEVENKIVFTGPKRVSDVPDLVNAMDVAVGLKQPFPKWHAYSQPLKILEYMACGVRVVATPLLEQSRLVQESGGGTVAAGFDSSEIAAAILSERDASRRRLLGKAAREYVVANHSLEAVTTRLLYAYDRVRGIPA